MTFYKFSTRKRWEILGKFGLDFLQNPSDYGGRFPLIPNILTKLPKLIVCILTLLVNNKHSSVLQKGLGTAELKATENGLEQPPISPGGSLRCFFNDVL